MIRILNRLLVGCLFLLAVYHLSIYFTEIGILDLGGESIYPVYNISMNLIVVILIVYLIKTFTFPKKLYAVAVYPGLKVVYNVFLYVPWIKGKMSGISIDIWLFVFVGVIIWVLLTLKSVSYKDK